MVDDIERSPTPLRDFPNPDAILHAALQPLPDGQPANNKLVKKRPLAALAALEFYPRALDAAASCS
jgi:hypothetical protein